MGFTQLRSRLLATAERAIRESFSKDEIIIEAVNGISDIDKAINLLDERIASWKSILSGAKISNSDIGITHQFEETLTNLASYRKNVTAYMTKLCEEIAPKTTALAGAVITARLIAAAGGLRRLAFLPASTIQVLGAREAVLRHVKTGEKSPKHGIIFAHPSINKALRTDRGKRARALASKLAVAARMDYFRQRSP
ncbi:hypothetical protein HY490_05870 [Candidatus Woesearchaeota archaeon]|nr:hypothetical protein [Candidatus Woesearchaeota archaeon]